MALKEIFRRERAHELRSRLDREDRIEIPSEPRIRTRTERDEP